MVPLDLILSGLNYYALTFKLIIWYNALVVYARFYNVLIFKKKYLHVITSVINSVITYIL